MNITKELKYLFENLCLLVAFCMPTSLLAVETITMDPECVSMQKNGSNWNAMDNSITITIENAEPGTEYRLVDDGTKNGGNKSQTISFSTTDEISSGTYQTIAHITDFTCSNYFNLKRNRGCDNNDDYKNTDFLVREFTLYKKDENGNFVVVRDPATNLPVTKDVYNCYLKCGSMSSSDPTVKTVSSTCEILASEIADQLAEMSASGTYPTGVLPTLYNADKDGIGYVFVKEDMSSDDIAIESFKAGTTYKPRVWVTYKGVKVDICSQKLNIEIKSCPEFTTPEFDANATENGKCVALNADVVNGLGGSSQTFEICNNTTQASLTGWSSDNFEPNTYKAIWQFSGYTCPQTFKVVSPNLRCVAPADVTLDVSSGCRQTTLTLPSLDGMCGDLSIYWRRQSQKDSTLVTSASSSYTTDFYPSDVPYVIIWTVTDGAVAKNCQSTVTVTKTGMSCPDLTIISDGGKVSIPLPAVPIGCGITRTVADTHGLTESGDVLTGTLNPGTYSFSVAETPESGSASSCTFNVLVVEKADICK